MPWLFGHGWPGRGIWANTDSAPAPPAYIPPEALAEAEEASRMACEAEAERLAAAERRRDQEAAAETERLAAAQACRRPQSRQEDSGKPVSGGPKNGSENLDRRAEGMGEGL
jgi:hypothetical protein